VIPRIQQLPSTGSSSPEARAREAFSELNDPDDQRKRFLEQEQLRTAGDEEAQRIDAKLTLRPRGWYASRRRTGLWN